ncbi:hypothetical protein ILUMI_03261, partial [Ignelater luminosus]
DLGNACASGNTGVKVSFNFKNLTQIIHKPPRNLNEFINKLIVKRIKFKIGQYDKNYSREIISVNFKKHSCLMEQAIGIFTVLFFFFLCCVVILGCSKICNKLFENGNTTNRPNPGVIQSSILLSDEIHISQSSTTAPFLRNNLQTNQRLSSHHYQTSSIPTELGFTYSSEMSCSNHNGVISSRRNMNTTTTIGPVSNSRTFSNHTARTNETSNNRDEDYEQPPPSYAEATAMK